MNGAYSELRDLRVNGQRHGQVERRRDQTRDEWAGLKLAATPLLLAAAMVWWLARHPVVTAATAVVVLAWRSAGLWLVVALAVLSVTALVVWRHRHRSSFDRLIANRARAAARGWWVYKRRWRATMTLTGLAAIFEHAVYLPRIRKIRSDKHADHVLVRLLSGQDPDDYQTRASALANTFDALSCRVRVDRPGRVWLDLMRHDPLAAIVPALEPSDVPDLTELVLGVREDGQPWTLRLLDTHLLTGGATDSGKSSALWSLIRSMGPLVRAGTVALWVIDPKGGMELAPGWACYTRFAYQDPTTMADLLGDAEQLVRTRAARMRGITRHHTPSPADPLVVLIIDELAALASYLLDRDTRRRITASLSVILTQGRAVGVTVVAAVQDPRKDVLPFRDLFPTRIALRMTEASQVDMILGDGAHTRGAVCERIPVTQPGVGYVLLDGHREPVRVRAAQATDTDITDLTHRYAAPASITGEQPSDSELAAVVHDWTTGEASS